VSCIAGNPLLKGWRCYEPKNVFVDFKNKRDIMNRDQNCKHWCLNATFNNISVISWRSVLLA